MAPTTTSSSLACIQPAPPARRCRSPATAAGPAPAPAIRRWRNGTGGAPSAAAARARRGCRPSTIGQVDEDARQVEQPGEPGRDTKTMWKALTQRSALIIAIIASRALARKRAPAGARAQALIAVITVRHLLRRKSGERQPCGYHSGNCSRGSGTCVSSSGSRTANQTIPADAAAPTPPAARAACAAMPSRAPGARITGLAPAT